MKNAEGKVVDVDVFLELLRIKSFLLPLVSYIAWA